MLARIATLLPISITLCAGIGKRSLKGARWLPMKTSFRLVLEKDEHTRLREALQLTGHCLLHEDDLRRIWQQEDKESAEFPLSDWIERAMVSGVGMLERFANTLVAFRSGILAYMISSVFPQLPWRAPITKSRHFEKWLMAFGIWSSSS
uniref:Transposase n=1 Tax=Candidatus Kentrum sp. TC TaxID=2126339 RepID=A0A450Z5U0_9GAMM|nr:MAG: Transposase [Candidatus Kentron sp. TC]VFK64988.1 MAG: Transposase [Candidatus Kentron sp. TC]